MNKNETLTLWLSIGLALFAVMLLYSYTQEKSIALTKKFGVQSSVVVSGQDINEMETINESMLQLKDFPSDFIQPGSLTKIEDAVGLVALAPIGQGEQIIGNKIIRPGPVTGLSLQVTPQRRALTIPIDDMRGVAKLIKPGDRIDLLAALTTKTNNQNKKYVKTIMQDVVILAAGSNIVNELPRLHEEDGNQDFIKNIRSNINFSTITIEADPKEIQNLVYILSTSPGALFIALRHPSDRLKRVLSRTTSIENLLGRKLTQVKRTTTILPKKALNFNRSR